MAYLRKCLNLVLSITTHYVTIFYPLDSSNDHLAANSNLNPLDPSSELENLTVVDYSHNLGEIVDSA